MNNSETEEALKTRADIHFNRGELSEALETYLKLLPRRPDDLEVLHGLAATLLKGGQKQVATGVYQKILKISASDSLARQNLSLLSNVSNATALPLEEGVAPTQFRDEARMAVSFPSVTVGNQTAAGPARGRSIPIDVNLATTQPALAFMAGIGLYREGKRDAAIDECWKAVNALFRSEDVEACMRLARPVLRIFSTVLAESGRNEGIVSLAEVAANRLCDPPASVQYLVALALAKLQRPVEAAALLRRLKSSLDQSGSLDPELRSLPTISDIDYLLAHSEASVYEFDPAEKGFQRVTERDTFCGQARLALARIAAAKVQMDQAAKILLEALAANPWDTAIWSTGHTIAKCGRGTFMAEEAPLPNPVLEIAREDWEAVCLGSAAELLECDRDAEAVKLMELNFDKDHPAYRATQLIVSRKKRGTEFRQEYLPSGAEAERDLRAVSVALHKLRRSATSPVIDGIVKALPEPAGALRSTWKGTLSESPTYAVVGSQSSAEVHRRRIAYDDIAPEIQEFFQRSGNPDRICRIATKEAIATGIASLVNRHFDFKPNAFNQRAKRELRSEGISRLGKVFSESEVQEVVGYFRRLPVYNSHVWRQSDGVPRFIHEDAKKHRFGSYKQLEILNAPYLLETALSPKILNIAEEYLGCVPLLFSINTWWNFGGFHTTVGMTQGFHRDLDDYRFLSFFIFLTDVGENGGQHVYIRKTHRKEALLDHVRDGALLDSIFSDGDYGSSKFPENAAKLADLIEDFRGSAGHGFIADTFGLHRGAPSERDRFVCWCRYGLHKNYAYEYDQTCRIPLSQLDRKLVLSNRTRYITSLILDDEK